MINCEVGGNFGSMCKDMAGCRLHHLISERYANLKRVTEGEMKECQAGCKEFERCKQFRERMQLPQIGSLNGGDNL